MTREEALNVLLEIRPCIIDNAQEDALDIAINALSKPFFSSGLDEAAKKCVTSIIYEHGRYDGDFLIPVCEDIFKAGAEWMTEQGEIVLGNITRVGNRLDVETLEYLPEESEFENGDKVIVQIRKND